jgi:hypothetical protein
LNIETHELFTYIFELRVSRVEEAIDEREAGFAEWEQPLQEPATFSLHAATAQVNQKYRKSRAKKILKQKLLFA